MKEGKDKHGKYQEVYVVWSSTLGRYIEVDSDSETGKLIRQKQYQLNKYWQRNREKKNAGNQN